MLRGVLAVLFVLALVGCGATGNSQSSYRTELLEAATANNIEELRAIGVDVSDEAIECMAAASLGGLSDDELREAGITTDNVSERLPGFFESRSVDPDAPPLESVAAEVWNCLDRDDFVALTGADQVGEDILNCVIDEVGYEAVREFSIDQSIAEESGGEPADSAELTAAAVACAGED